MKLFLLFRQPLMINHWLSIPNTISILRLIMAWPLAHAISHDYTVLVLLLTSIAILSDFLDGHLARKFNQVSDIGKALDPICDAVLAFSVIFTLFYLGKLPTWYVTLVSGRYIVIATSLLHYQLTSGKTPSAIQSGKWSILIMAITLILAWQQTRYPLAFQASIFLSSLMLLISFRDYLQTYYHSEIFDGLLLLSIDQYGKHVSLHQLWSMTQYPLFQLVSIKNHGMGLGVLGDLSWLYLAIIQALVLIWVIRLNPPKSVKILLLSGGISNLIDRITYGFIIDYIQFQIHIWQWPAVVNLADLYLTIGVLLWLYHLKNHSKIEY